MKIIAYTELTENGLLIHYPSKAVKAEIEKKIAELEKEDRVEK